jgi:heme/copper-type cytochrome/quinol oxidase subunit 2
MKQMIKMAVSGAITLMVSMAPAQAASRTISVSITDHGFVPNQIIALVNQPVQVKVTNQGHKVHQFSIPNFRIYTERLSPGQSSTVGFSPWTTGRFQMMSDPSGQGRAEFSGTFIVTDQK